VIVLAIDGKKIRCIKESVIGVGDGRLGDANGVDTKTIIEIVIEIVNGGR
jgi:hypothetical protein